MKVKQLGLLAAFFAAGYLVALFVERDRESRAPSVKQEVRASVVSGAKDDVEMLRANYDRRIVELESQLETVRARAEKLDSILNPVGRTTAERRTLQKELHQRSLESAKKRETEMLLAAGYSMDRIDWLSKRTEELSADYRRAEDLAKQQGRLNSEVMMTHIYDSDIDLRYEMGDDEYAKYRQALGRSAGMEVAKVMPGGIGEGVGLKPGDEIIAYNGTRIFNMGELTPLLRKYSAAGTVVTIDVLRNGQKVRLPAAGGDLRITATPPVSSTEDLKKLMAKVDSHLVEKAKAAEASK